MNASSTPAQSTQDYSAYVQLLGNLQSHRLFLEAQLLQNPDNHDLEEALQAIRKASLHVNFIVAAESFERDLGLTVYRFVF
jgi:hypothetical protein